MGERTEPDLSNFQDSFEQFEITEEGSLECKAKKTQQNSIQKVFRVGWGILSRITSLCTMKLHLKLVVFVTDLIVKINPAGVQVMISGTFPIKREQGSLKKWVILGLEQNRYELSMEIVIPEHEDVKIYEVRVKMAQELISKGSYQPTM